LGKRHFLLGDHISPEGVCVLGLRDALRGKKSVGPLKLAIAVFSGPVALLLIRKRDVEE
jgi:hypothetical protein